jgi:hypothetical protein
MTKTQKPGDRAVLDPKAAKPKVSPSISVAPPNPYGSLMEKPKGKL